MCEYQCTSVCFIKLSNRIEKSFVSVNQIELNFFSPNWNALAVTICNSSVSVFGCCCDATLCFLKTWRFNLMAQHCCCRWWWWLSVASLRVEWAWHAVLMWALWPSVALRPWRTWHRICRLCTCCCCSATFDAIMWEFLWCFVSRWSC